MKDLELFPNVKEWIDYTRNCFLYNLEQQQALKEIDDPSCQAFTYIDSSAVLRRVRNF